MVKKKKPSYSKKVVINIKHKKQRKPNFRLIAVGIVVVVIVIIAIFFLLKRTPSNVAAVVNGDKITVEELENAYTLVPDFLKSTIPKAMILQQLIDNKLLLQEADRYGITVIAEEVDQSIQEILIKTQMTEETLKQTLAAQNVNYEYFKEMHRRKVLITKLLRAQGRLKVTEAEIYNYYVQNKEQIGKSISEAEYEIRQKLEQERFDSAQQIYIKELRQNAEVRVLYKE